MKLILFIALGSFSLGLDAYVMAGLLPSIAPSMQVSLSAAGQLVSVFMLCYALLSPVFATLLTGKKAGAILGTALIIFVMANVLSAISTSFSCLLVSRMLAGIGAGIYLPFALTTATRLTPPAQKGRVLALVMGGMSAGTILGVPVGLLLAAHFGWRASFLFVAVIGSIALMAQLRYLPAVKLEAPPSLRARISALKNKRLIAIIMVSALCAMAGLGLYTYLPVLFASAGLTHSTIIQYLLMWSIGGIIGTYVSGHLLDRFKQPFNMVMVILSVIILVMLLLPIFVKTPPVAMLLLLFWGAAGWGLQVPQQCALMAVNPDHAAVSLALAGSARYLGIAIGTAGIGVLLSLGLPLMALPWVTGGVIFFALIIHFTFVRRPSLTLATMGDEYTHRR